MSDVIGESPTGGYRMFQWKCRNMGHCKDNSRNTVRIVSSAASAEFRWRKDICICIKRVANTIVHDSSIAYIIVNKIGNRIITRCGPMANYLVSFSMLHYNKTYLSLTGLSCQSRTRLPDRITARQIVADDNRRVIPQ